MIAVAFVATSGLALALFTRGLNEFVFQQTSSVREDVARAAALTLQAGDRVGDAEALARVAMLLDRLQGFPGASRVALVDASGKIAAATGGFNVGARTRDPLMQEALRGRDAFDLLNRSDSLFFGAVRVARLLVPLRDSRQIIGIAEMHLDVSRLFAFSRLLQWMLFGVAVVLAAFLSLLIARALREYQSRLAAQAQVIRQGARDEALLRSIGEAVIAVDEQARMIFANAAASQLFGWHTDAPLGRDVFSSATFANADGLALPRDRHPVAVALRARATANVELADKIFAVVNSRRIPISAIATPYRFDGEIAGAILAVRDATKEYEVDRAKSEFVSLAAHQLRTPLTSIRWNIEMLRTEGETALTDEEREHVSRMDVSAARMSAIVRALLNVSRLELGTFCIEPTRMSLTAAAREVMRELQPLTQARGVRVLLDAPEDMEYRGDPRLFAMVLQNLLSNAIKYSATGSIVRCSIRKDDAWLTLAVQDYGIGIPEKDQPNIFHKLFRADNARAQDADGNGLGLYLVKGIVEAAGGEITFVSRAGKGTTFTVRLPAEGMKAHEGSMALT